jgi:fused signal recognition particle receptor
MFGFLKKKVKSAISTFSKKFDEEAEVVEEKVVETPKKVTKQKPKEKKKEVKKETTPVKKESVKEETKESVKEEASEEPAKKGFFSKITEKVTSKKISVSQFDELFWDMEIELLENNVAFEVIEKIKEDLKDKLVNIPLKRGQVANIITASLQSSIEELLDFERVDLLEKIKEKQEKPYVICFLGTNGSGKTTSIGKVAHFLKKNNVSSVMVAADTFRAAAIQQLEVHGKNLDIKVIKHDYGSDPAAISFDAIKFAKQKGIDVVLIDTSGRLHSNKNLMKELEKIIRIAKPDMKILVAESITGNDAVDQAKNFNAAVGIDGSILTKSDVDEKGGTIISMAYVSQKPIIYLGVGQEYEDLKVPEKKEILESIGLKG